MIGTQDQSGFTPNRFFVLVRKATPDKVMQELKHFKGKVPKTSLTRDQQWMNNLKNIARYLLSNYEIIRRSTR